MYWKKNLFKWIYLFFIFIAKLKSWKKNSWEFDDWKVEFHYRKIYWFFLLLNLLSLSLTFEKRIEKPHLNLTIWELILSNFLYLTKIKNVIYEKQTSTEFVAFNNNTHSWKSDSLKAEFLTWIDLFVKYWWRILISIFFKKKKGMLKKNSILI